MQIPIKIGDKTLYPESVILIRNRDRTIEAVYQQQSAVEVDAKSFPCKSLENRAAIQQALTDGYEFFCAVLSSGYARFWVKDAKWLAAAESIADSIDKECLKDMPDSKVKH